MGSGNLSILAVDDDEDKFFLIQRAFWDRVEGVDLRFVQGGEEMIEYLRHQGRFEDPNSAPLPSLILLDINMPRMDGMAALGEIKTDSSFRHIPVVMLTTSNDPDDITAWYRLAASSNLVKPAAYSQLVITIPVSWTTGEEPSSCLLDATTDQGLTQFSACNGTRFSTWVFLLFALAAPWRGTYIISTAYTRHNHPLSAGSRGKKSEIATWFR